MPEKDEFGGVAVSESDQSDEFGGVPIEEGPSEADTEEILKRPALPAWEGAGEDTLRAPTTWERIRSSDAAHAILGPTEAEKAAMEERGPESMLGAPGGDVGIVPIGAKMLSMTSVPPQAAKPIRRVTDPLIDMLPAIPKGIVKGGRELALTVPTAPFGALSKIALPAFGAEMAASFPGEKKAYDQAVKEGRYDDAAQIATQVVGGSALLGLGTAHEFRSKPTLIPEPVPEPGQPAPEVVPAPLRTIEKTVGPDGQPIEVLEINKQKKTALVRPEGQPEAAPSVVPLSEVTTKEVPVEVPAEQKGPNASSEPETATPNGNLRTSSEPSAGEVPAAEGGGGIQPQTGGGLRQAEAQAGEVSLKELAPEEKALTDAAAESNRKQGLDSEIEVVSEEAQAGETPDIMYVRGGKIFLNLPVFRRWLRRISPNQRQAAVESLLNEEGVHLGVRRAVGDASVSELWKSLTKAEQNLVKRSYFGKEWRKAADVKPLSDAQMGHEYIRRLLQWGMNVNPTELAASKGKGLEWITQKGIDVALKGIDAVRRALPTESGRNVKAMLDQVEANLNAVKQAAPQEAPLKAAQEQVTKVAETQGKRSAKEIKSELVTRLEEALKAPRDQSGKFVEIDIPGDGTFKIRNNQGAITEALKAAKRLNTSSGSSRPGVINSSARLTQTQKETFAASDAIKLYGSPGEAYRRLKSQLDRSQELEFEPQQVQDLARVVERLKNSIEEPLKVARRRVSDMEDREQFLKKQFAKLPRGFEENLQQARNEEAAAKIRRDEAMGEKGEKLSAKAGLEDYPVQIEDAEGNKKTAYFNGYYDLRPAVAEPMVSVGYKLPDGTLTHGMVGPGEKVIGKIPSFDEWKAMPEKAEKLSAKAEETADEVAKMSPEQFMKFSEDRASTGGFTKVAHEIGRDAPSAEFAAGLKARADQFNREFSENRKAMQAETDMQKKIALMNKGASLSTRAQFFQEAHDYALADPKTSGGQWAIKEGHVPKFGPQAKGNAIADAARYRQALREEKLEKLSAKSPVAKAVDELNNRRRALGTLWRGRVNRDVMDQTIDAADNKANVVGQQMGNRLRIGTDKLRREATMAVVEAGNNPNKLTDFLTKAQTGGNEDAVRAVRYAQANWAALQPDALRVKRILDGQISQEQGAGISTEYRDAYVPHIYDRDLLMGSGRPFVIAGGSGTGSGFKKGRTFENVFDAIEAGYTPKTLDVADLVEHRVKVGQKIINRKSWAESLAGLNDPTDGKPLSAPLIRKSRGPGRPGYEVAPSGYRPVEILPGIRTAIHEAYLPLFNALTGESFISGSVPGKLLLEAAGGIKHGLLVFDSFHASRIFQKLLTLAPGKVLSGKAGYERGQSLLEYADADLNRAVAENLITPEIATWVRNNRFNANLLLDNGLNVGRIQEGLYNSVVRQIPGIGTFNKWVFEKLTRGALMEAGLIELERVAAAKPGVPRGTIARQVARDLNAYFGNLGRQGIFKSKSAQDIARLVALAPQWVESMARTELKGAAQIVKGATYDPIVHKTIMTGTIGKGVAQGLIAYLIGTQVVNYITRGHSTFQNPEDNHKLDAWIPDVTGKGHGFFLSPFSVVAELTHDMLRYSSKEPTLLEAATRIAANKASPIFRAGKVLLTGRDYDGKQITDTWRRVKAAAFALAPTPIPLAPTIKGSAYPGQTQRQLTASLGFKTEPAESQTQQIVNKAKQFMIETGKRKPVMLEPAEDEPAYYKLRDLLRKDDEKGAREMLAELRKTHSPKQIMTAMRNHVKRPFTGSRANEAAFRSSLSSKDRDVYDRARDEQRQEYQQFLKLWYK